MEESHFSIKELKKLTERQSVLYVEDETALRDSFSLYLSKLFKEVVTASNGIEGLEAYKKRAFDIVITDINMPEMNGLDMSTNIKNIKQDQKIIIVSAYSDTETFIKSIKIGIEGYIIKPVNYTQITHTLFKVSKIVQTEKENIEYKNNLEQMVEERTQKIKQLYDENVENYKDTITALVELIENRDTYTGGHSQRVARYSLMIAQKMGLSKKDCDKIFEAATLHDIGKIAIPDAILLKPGKLTKDEYEIIKTHVDVGYDILKKIPMYEDLAEVINGHHERYDGSGYPNRLKGDNINIFSQILAISDAFDAMTTNRIYKSRKSKKEAIAELQSLSGITFSSTIVENALEVLKDTDISDIINQFPSSPVDKARFSYFFNDQITDLYNSTYLSFILEKNNEEFNYNYIYTLTINNFYECNKKNGWKYTNQILKDIATQIESHFKDKLKCRLHGVDFVIASKNEVEFNIDKLELKTIIEKNNLDIKINKFNIQGENINSLEDLEKLLYI